MSERNRLTDTHAAETGAPREDRFQRVQDFIDSCSQVERQVAILRLMRMDNNGDEHFDHGSERAPALGYSWACLACQQMGRGGLNGWVGAFEMMAEVAQHLGRDDA